MSENNLNYVQQVRDVIDAIEGTSEELKQYLQNCEEAMYQIAIVEDEAAFRRQLTEYLTQY